MTQCEAMLRRSLLALTLLLAACGMVSGQNGGPEYRGYWVETFNTPLGTRADIDRIVESAVQSNANALFVQVRRRGDSWYLESREPLTEVPNVGEPDASGRWTLDPLRYLLDQAHAKGLEVHAFTIVGAVYRDDPAVKLPVDPNHVFLQHVWDRTTNAPYTDDRQWATRTLDGTMRFGSDFYLDLGHPAAAAYTVDVLNHLVAHYAVDGIHLDRVRYPEVDAIGYNATSVARFNARHGRTGDPAPNDAQWSAWRREQVTAFVRRLYLTTKSIRPQVKVSAALITFSSGPTASGGFARTEAYTRVFQDWESWAREGILDLFAPMDYKRESRANEAAQFDDWLRFTVNTTHANDRLALIGLGAYLNSIDSTLAQTRRAREAGADGVIFYSLATTNADLRPVAEFSAALRNGPFATAVPPPVKTLTTGHVMGFANEGDEVTIAPVGGATIRTVRADGNGFFGFPHLAPGRYVVLSCTVEVLAGNVTTLAGNCGPRRRAAR